jgi:flagellar protein FlgJ
MNVSGINNNMVSTNIENAKSQAQNSNFENVLKKAYNDKDKKELKKVCQQFEQMFMGMMLKEMRATVPKADPSENDFAQQTFQDMLDDKYTEESSKGKGIGLSDMLYKNLVKQMDSTYAPASVEKEVKKIDLPKQEIK